MLSIKTYIFIFTILVLGSVIRLVVINESIAVSTLDITSTRTGDSTSTAAPSTSSQRVHHHPRGTSKPLCHDLDSLTKGQWNEQSNLWEPESCQYIPFTNTDLQQCIANDHQSFTFYGDSLLKNIASQFIKLGNASESIKLEAWGPGPTYFIGGGDIDTAQEGKGEQQNIAGRVAMYWTPSAYFQKPHSVGNMAKDDVSIINIGVWDMGTYYRGINKWFKTMQSLLTEAAKKRQGKPLFVMQLHKLYSSKCKQVHDTDEGLRKSKLCQACNSDDAIHAFRSALEHVVKCVQSEGFENVYLIDAFGVTNSSFAEDHTADGVHYDPLVSRMELEVLLSAVCHGMRHNQSQMGSLVCPDSPGFELEHTSACKQKRRREREIVVWEDHDESQFSW